MSRSAIIWSIMFGHKWSFDLVGLKIRSLPFLAVMKNDTL